jgi:hypothetical protein
MHWHYQDPTTKRLVKSNFERPGITVTYQDVFNEIKNHHLTHCNLWDKNITDSSKFEAIKIFARNKIEGLAFNNISQISHCDFASILLYLRNHVQHVGQERKGFTRDEIKDIETIIMVFFELNPINDKSISMLFHHKTTTALKEYSADEVRLLEKLSENLQKNTAQARLQDWIADLTLKYGDLLKKQDSGSLVGHNSIPSCNGIKIRIGRYNSKSYFLPKYVDIIMTLPNDIVLNVGSRGFAISELQHFGHCFDQSNAYSLAVEGIHHIIHYYISLSLLSSS